MDKEVTEMTKADTIESSVSEYASSPVVVRTPDGSVRYWIAFRKLNAKTEFDADRTCAESGSDSKQNGWRQLNFSS